MHAITVESVSKIYHRHTGQRLLRDRALSWFRRRSEPAEPFYALRGVSFTLDHGESVALVGHNGAGKSTLLSLVSGLTYPDEGRVKVNGRVGALLELGSGFHPDLTGTENIHLNAALLGYTERQTKESMDEIVDFAELRDFIDEPIRTYSTGMVMRLAFSVAVRMSPDILILDEIMAVGDHAFQLKCFEKVREFREQGKTILCVSHAAASLADMCTRAIWLDHGQLVLDGDLQSVVGAYEGRLAVPPSS